MSQTPSAALPDLPSERPSRLDIEVRRETARVLLRDFRDWMQTRHAWFRDDGLLLNELADCLKHVDPFKAMHEAVVLHGWPGDYEGVELFRRSAAPLRKVVERLTQRWIVSTGIRFPARADDTVTYLRDSAGLKVRQTGVVITVDRNTATAVLRVIWNGKKNEAVRINAEDVCSVTPAVTVSSPSPEPIGGGTAA
ncbi:hypothetical protein [Candidatus Macondimonas diazotrophica]|uniref:Uncharacterized protein n=1 Tax=Candidatus Macondimonas diazotrophica TaxID=2305248 RepID=A0A4Z0F5R1_9GAMM|nr:hypothetical protein [Candidatus Macondimonas diazotrophica]TFZ81294.1 hypothetical protein E4680_13080 [Candidatus Macondimonas diazotrophica]